MGEPLRKVLEMMLELMTLAEKHLPTLFVIFFFCQNHVENSQYAVSNDISSSGMCFSAFCEICDCRQSVVCDETSH